MRDQLSREGGVTIARIVGRAVANRSPLVVLVTAVVGLMFPAGAMAYDHAITTAGVTKKDGFRLSLNIVQAHRCLPGGCGYGGGPTRPSVTGVLARKRGHVTQTASYDSFRIKFTNSNNLSSASVKGTFANGHGSIDMTFTATGPVIHKKACDGEVLQGRRGVLNGTYALNAGKFFGKVAQKSFTATLWNGANPEGCSPRPRYQLLTKRLPSVLVSKARGTGLVSEAIGVAKAGIVYSYLVTGEPGRDYKVGSKIRSATVTGAGGISGTATYSATRGRPRRSAGTLSGRFAVTMTAIGRVRPLANGPRGAIQLLYGAV
jgi:hypothetical protein